MKRNSLSVAEKRRLEKVSCWARKKILDMALRVGAGHIAPSFSCIDILVFLYHGGILRVDSKNPNWDKRDRFILSKGHASIALYPILASKGFFSLSELDIFSTKNSNLGVHAESKVPGIEVSTGSLGHGLSIGSGIAYAGKLDNKKYRVFVLIGDGECYEGSIWEAANFAGNFKLNNLIAIIDYNKFSAISSLKRQLPLSDFKKRWESFKWQVKVANGHSFTSLSNVFKNIHSISREKPLAIIARTVKGKDISFMENKAIWHYRVPIGNEIYIAKEELSRKKCL